MTTKRETTKNIIIDLAANTIHTVNNLHAKVADKGISKDTVRDALKELVAEGKVEKISEGRFVSFKVLRQDTKLSLREIEDSINQTRFDRGWKTKAILGRLLDGTWIARHELALLVGSDCHNIAMIIKKLNAAGTKYTNGPLNIAYDKTTRSYRMNLTDAAKITW